MNNGDQSSSSVSERADAIFCAALEIKGADKQKVFVDTACAGNAAVRQEVDLLFASLEKSEEFFQDECPTQISAAEIARTLTEIPAFFENMKSALPDDGEVGKQVGPYKLLQKIGEGGVGNVYLAEQVKPVQRQVAFKIIKRGMDIKSVIARFEVERQALARMEHPNIAHVLDAGETETGRPFFVMELVHGIRITTYCEENNLSVRQRLELLMQVCRGIQHAHQKGIIHRDIKPSNVLVTLHDGVPMPKVIDFGIAKATTDDLTADQTVYTSAEPFIGTPAYMSPEQAQTGMDVDTRSDIYSLGILLYELLASEPPFDHKELMKSGVDGMRRTLSECEPQRPSVRILRQSSSVRDELARSRSTDIRHLQAMLQGDLDWIVLKALEKDRTRRYETVDAFTMDIERFLNNEPVLARSPSRVYRFSKMVRRNKAVFTSVLVISLILMAWLGTSSWLFIRERDARKRAVSAEQQEKRLRLAAEERERITQAAFYISQGKLEEADRIVDPVGDLTPSLEAESVLRTLGEWHALNGRWELAAERFKLLLKVDIKDSSWRITDDFLMAGSIFIERGNVEEYEHFRRASIDMYKGTTSPIFAERTLKICLIRPADEQLLQSMQPLADLILPGTRGDMIHSWAKAWRGISLALFDYRKGDYRSAIAWSVECRTCIDKNPARDSIAHFIHAMAAQKLGDAESARTQLDMGRGIVTEVFRHPLEKGDGQAGYWYDWMMARILLREAESLFP